MGDSRANPAGSDESAALGSVTSTPCSDCPWRRNALRGWLGPLSAAEWVALAHSDEPIACHQTIVDDGEWAPGTMQCAGAAIYRANVCKSPRNPAIVKGEVNRERVFARPDEFTAHHSSPLADWLAEQREPDGNARNVEGP